MDRNDAHHVIRDVASRQFGAVSRRQLLEIGVSKGVLRYSLDSGRLLKLFPGAYVLGRRADSYRTVWMAATMAAGPGAALAGDSAAAAWGFGKPRDLITVVRPKGRTYFIRGESPFHQRFRVSVRSSQLLPGGLVKVGPIPACSVAATLIQQAGTLSRYQLRRVFIEASRQRTLNKSILEECLSLGAAFKGMSNLAELIRLWHPESAKTKSYLEGEFFLLCRQRGIPTPKVNAWVGGKEVDCLWENERVMVELDSRTFHDDMFAFDRDRVRQNAAVVGGFRVLRFTYRMITDEPELVMDELALVLKKSS